MKLSLLLSLLLLLLLLSLNVFTESSSAQAALFGDDGNDKISLYCMSRKLRFVNKVVNSQCTQPSGVLHFMFYITKIPYGRLRF